MSADPLVQAVAEALDRPQPYGDCTHPDANGRYYGPCVVCDAAAVLAALVPLIRTQVAEEIRALPTLPVTAHSTAYRAGLIDGYRTAVSDASELAEGTDRG
jgi:hypothetical protein